MKHSSIILPALFVLVSVVVGCTESLPDSEPQNQDGIEYIGGLYNLTLVVEKIKVGNATSVIKKIRYVKDGEVMEPDQILPDSMRPGLDWLKENTEPGAVIMAWWDYGNAIRAYAEREPVIDAPSKEILTATVSKYLGKSPEEIDCPSCTKHGTLQRVAKLLLTEDSAESVEIMKEFGAGFLYVHVDDGLKSVAMYLSLNQEPKKITSTVLEKALEKKPIDGFELVYDDDIARVYGLK